MRRRSVLFALATTALLQAPVASSLPRWESRHAPVGIEEKRLPAGRLDGWEMHLQTDTEMAICMDPIVYPEIKVIRCRGIAILGVLPEVP